MKKIFFILQNIFHSLKSEKLLSVLIILGMVICDTIFLVFGNVYWSDTKSNEYTIYTNNIATFQFDKLNINEFLDELLTKEYITSAVFSHTDYSGSSAVHIAAYYPEYDPDMCGKIIGKFLSGDDQEFLVNDDFVNEQLFSDLPLIKIDDKLTFLGKERVCVGIISTGVADKFDYLININDFKVNITDNITAAFRFKNGTSLIDVQNFANELNGKFYAQYMVIPNKTTAVSFIGFLSDMSSMLVLLTIAIINYMFIYRFLLIKRTYIYGVYKMFGMNNIQMFSLLSIEMLFLSIISYVISIFVFICGLTIQETLSTMAGHVPELGFAFIIIMVLNTIFFIITAAKTIVNSPIELIKESEVS